MHRLRVGHSGSLVYSTQVHNCHFCTRMGHCAQLSQEPGKRRIPVKVVPKPSFPGPVTAQNRHVLKNLAFGGYDRLFWSFWFQTGNCRKCTHVQPRGRGRAGKNQGILGILRNPGNREEASEDRTDRPQTRGSDESSKLDPSSHPLEPGLSWDMYSLCRLIHSSVADCIKR